MVKTATICSAVCVLATMLACSVQTPVTPAPTPVNAPKTAADGSTIKATAPTLVSPINNDVIASERPTFVINTATGLFAKVAFFYEFELSNDAGQLVRSDTADTTTLQLPVTLAFDSPYRWRARAVLDGGNIGPWSSQGRFFTPKPPELGRPTRSSSNEEWRLWFFQLVRLRNQPTVSVAAMAALRVDLLAVDADWQNGWRGDLRPRLFLPAPGCNGTAANNPSPPFCAFSRTVDVGDIGGPWQWVYRGQT